MLMAAGVLMCMIMGIWGGLGCSCCLILIARDRMDVVLSGEPIFRVASFGVDVVERRFFLLCQYSRLIRLF